MNPLGMRRAPTEKLHREPFVYVVLVLRPSNRIVNVILDRPVAIYQSARDVPEEAIREAQGAQDETLSASESCLLHESIQRDVADHCSEVATAVIDRNTRPGPAYTSEEQFDQFKVLRPEREMSAIDKTAVRRRETEGIRGRRIPRQRIDPP
jgi:hypothetical protein